MSKIEEKYGLKSKSAIALFICLLLVICICATTIIQMIQVWNGGITFIAMPVVNLITIIATVYYALMGYKKPHGNILRNIFVLYAAICASAVILTRFSDPKYITAIVQLEVVLIAFMAGRLNKFRQNLAIIVIVAICSLVYAIYYLSLMPDPYPFSIASCFNAFSSLIYWLTMSVAYIVRYKEHKEAGLADK